MKQVSRDFLIQFTLDLLAAYCMAKPTYLFTFSEMAQSIEYFISTENIAINLIIICKLASNYLSPKITIEFQQINLQQCFFCQGYFVLSFMSLLFWGYIGLPSAIWWKCFHNTIFDVFINKPFTPCICEYIVTWTTKRQWLSHSNAHCLDTNALVHTIVALLYMCNTCVSSQSGCRQRQTKASPDINIPLLHNSTYVIKFSMRQSLFFIQCIGLVCWLIKLLKYSVTYFLLFWSAWHFVG